MDREKVISIFEKIISVCKEDGCDFVDLTFEDAEQILALLKEQEQRIEQLEIDRDILVKDINTNNCNTCKRECEHKPIPGDVVRVNCFMWEGW